MVVNNAEYQQMSKQALREFEIAISSECWLDEHYCRVFGLNSDLYKGFPRPSKWVGFAKKNPKVIWIIFRLCELAWIVGGGAAYYFFQMSSYYGRSLFVPYKAFKNEGDAEYAVVFSRRAMDVIGDCSIGRSPQSWVLFPWVPQKSHDKGQHVLNVLSVVKFSDFIMAFWLSIRALYTIGLRRASRGGSGALPTYIAFQWFLARIALNKLGAGTFIISEHHDRWAVLVDCLVGRKSGDGASLTVVQHGVESNLKAAHRLKNVSALYVYDEDSLRAFEENIVDMSTTNKALNVCFYIPKIALSVLDDSRFPHDMSVLVVGHPSEEPLHAHIYDRLLKGRDINVIYKPHPTVRVSKRLRKMGWVVWEEKEEFPLVDLLIAYPSTLVEEYRAVGVEAAVHPYSIAVEDAQSYLSNLAGILEVFLTKTKGKAKND